MMRERIDFDTNTLISAALFRLSIPRQALDQALLYDDVLVSEATILELTSVLFRPRFDRYLSQAIREVFLASFLQQAQTITITEKITDCRDVNDNKFLELAVSGAAQTIVSGDDDLLSLDP